MRVSAILMTPSVARASAVRAVEREQPGEPLPLDPSAPDAEKRSDTPKQKRATPPRSPASRSSSAVQAALAGLKYGG